MIHRCAAQHACVYRNACSYYGFDVKSTLRLIAYRRHRILLSSLARRRFLSLGFNWTTSKCSTRLKCTYNVLSCFDCASVMPNCFYTSKSFLFSLSPLNIVKKNLYRWRKLDRILGIRVSVSVEGIGFCASFILFHIVMHRYNGDMKVSQ